MADATDLSEKLNQNEIPETSSTSPVKPVILKSTYEIVSFLDDGSFGKIMKALDLRNRQHVAIKCINDLEKTKLEDVLQEVNILSCLNSSKSQDKKYIVAFHGFFMNEGVPHFIFEYLPVTLKEVIYNRALTNDEATTVSFSILKALSFLSNLNVNTKIVHGDLKPENIMIDSSGCLKLIDFGLSFFEKAQTYKFCQTRCYRAPEVFLCKDFGCEIDMWSFACIAFECYIGRTLFDGDNNLEQMRLIAEVIGIPPNDCISTSDCWSKYFKQSDDKSYDFIKTDEKYRGPNSKTFPSIIDYCGFSDCDDLIYILSKIIIYDGSKRLKPNEVLSMSIFESHQATKINII